MVGQPSLRILTTADRGKVLETGSVHAVGQVIFKERPALAVTQGTGNPNYTEMQEWVEQFAALAPTVRAAVLELYCPERPAPGGNLDMLGGSTGSSVLSRLRCPVGFTKDELWRLLRIVEVNTFETPTADGRRLVELLLTTSRVNHSCSPNALRGPGAEAGTVEVRAIRPLAAGEEISISYVDEEVLMSPMPARRERLFGRWQFQCQCKRCATPDRLRAFRCSSDPACNPRGMVLAAPDMTSLAPCRCCGKSLTFEEAKVAFGEEQELIETVSGAIREAQIAAGSVSMALEQRDGKAFGEASEAAIKALARCGTVAGSHRAVHPSHHLVMGLAKAASALRAVLGDGLAAGQRLDKAREMWGIAARELQEATESQFEALPVPTDGRIGDLIGLGGLYRRLNKTAECKKCLSDAVDAMKATYWSVEPSRRAQSEDMQLGVAAAMAEL